MKIKIYTKNGDPYSQMLKNMLQFNNIEFENIEVSRNQEAFQEMLRCSGQINTPVLVLGAKVFYGFDREKIKEVLTQYLKI